MATIESLDVQIQASASNASKEIDKLTASLGRLANSLNFDARGLESLQRINGDNLSKIGNGINALSKGIRGFQNAVRVNFEAIGRDLKTLSSVPAEKIERLGNAIRPLASGMSALSRANIDGAKIQSISDGLTKLSRINLGNLDSTKLTQLGSSIKDFANAASGAKKIEQSTIAMTNAVAQLASAGEKIPSVTSSLDTLGTKMTAFMHTMSRAPQITSETTAFSQAIGTLASAGARTKDTADNLANLGTQLKSFMQTMSDAPSVSDNTIRMTDALARLAGQGGSVSVSTNSMNGSFSRSFSLSGKLSGNFKKLASAMSGLGSSAGKTANSFKSFLKQLASAAGVYFSIYGAIRGLKSAIDISSSLTEVQNVVDVAFGDMAYKIEEFTKTSVQDFGMSELTAKQIAGRYQSMASAIGVSADKVGRANDFLATQTDGYVAASDSMADVSVNLTKLAADMASFYDANQTDVAKSLESVFTGTTAPLRKYGLDLTQATLSEWAMKNGLDANIRSMSQAEKTMLRYQYVLANTSAAQGDFARTSGRLCAA